MDTRVSRVVVVVAQRVILSSGVQRAAIADCPRRVRRPGNGRTRRLVTFEGITDIAKALRSIHRVPISWQQS